MKYPSVKVAVFPVAGLGTRFLPATKAIPKEMLPIIDYPLIQYAVDEARDAGIETFVFITAQGKTAIEDHFDTAFVLESMLAARQKTEELAMLQALQLAPGQAVFVRQQEPKGLGHAVGCASHLVGNQPFALILPDDFILGAKSCLQELMEQYAQSGGNVIGVVDVPADHVDRYGILAAENDDGRCMRIKKVIEKPQVGTAPSQIAVIGRYILQPEIFTILDGQQAGIGGEVQLTDAFAALIKQQPFYGVRFSGQRFDCGTKEGWLEANIAVAYARLDLREHLLESIHRHTQKD